MKLELTWKAETFEVRVCCGEWGRLAQVGSSFPLTPALSRGERENDIPVRLQQIALGCSDGLVPINQQRGDEALDGGTLNAGASASPLPQGEGQGEGERGSRQQSRFGFTGDQNIHKGNFFVITDYATSTSNSDGSFPLTPALSRGERENCAPISLQKLALGCSGGLRDDVEEGEDEANDHRISNRRSNASPLPEGEGQGEGERGSRQQSRFGFTGEQNIHKRNLFVITDYATSTSNSDGSFPLTPTLSRGERENNIPVRLQMIALGCSGGSGFTIEEGGIDS